MEMRKTKAKTYFTCIINEKVILLVFRTFAPKQSDG